MTEFILHHYELSPFSQKIRSLLGHTALPWRSVVTKAMLPRPLLAPLAGGYRRIPVAQLGADIYCDTRLITRKIAQLSNSDIYPPQHHAQMMEVSAWADTRLLMLCVTIIGKSRYSINLLRHFNALDLPKFFLDRIRLMNGANTREMMPSHADREIKRFLRDFEHALSDDFRFGSAPTIADFSLYHPLWLACEIAGVPLLKDFPTITRWMRRMHNFGEGKKVPIGAADALAIAAHQEPLPLAPAVAGYSDHLINRQVVITPNDYGIVPVTGKLLYADQYQSVLQRQHPDAGALHVHFPREGFTVSTP